MLVNSTLSLGSITSSRAVAEQEELTIGVDARSAGLDTPFNGTIDEVRIYNRSLSSEDVYQHYKDRIGILLNWTMRTEPYEKDNNTILLMHFDGNFNDSSQYGNDGTGKNGVTFAPGRFGSLGAKFDGVDDYVNVSFTQNLDIIKSITVEAWVKLNEFGQRSTIVSKLASSTLRSYIIYT